MMLFLSILICFLTFNTSIRINSIKSVRGNTFRVHLLSSSLCIFTMLSIPTQSMSMTSDDYRVDINRNYVFEIKSSLDTVSQSITPETNVNKLYDEINDATVKTNMKERIRFLTNYYSQSINDVSCLQLSGDRAINDVNVIFEYFSISNDGKKKVMISDSYPGQKLKFIQQGLAAVRSDLQQYLFCPH